MKKYTEISSSAVVNMSDDWYDVVDLEHFWVCRGLEVFEKLSAHSSKANFFATIFHNTTKAMRNVCHGGFKEKTDI